MQIKQEFEKVIDEVLEIKQIVKVESGNSIEINLKHFESFKSNVVDQINELEYKINELCNIGNKYSNELEEQKKLFG